MGKKINAALQRAKDLLHEIEEYDSSMHGFSAPSNAAKKVADLSLEEVARRLLEEFQKSEDRRFFNLFYSLTQKIFYAYSYSHTSRFNNSLDPEEILNRLYILVFEKLLSATGSLPLDYLFPWCFKAMQNLASEEARALAKAKRLATKADPPPDQPSPMELLLDKEKRQIEKQKTHQILELLFSTQTGLSRRDRKIMRMYYLEGRTMREIGRVNQLATSHISVILMRARKRIARRMAWTERQSKHTELT